MASIVYSDDREPFTGRPIPYRDQPAVRYWASHYHNYRYLSFLAEQSDDREERRRAECEIRICQRRMDHWQRHQNWDAATAAVARAHVDAAWDSAPAAVRG